MATVGITSAAGLVGFLAEPDPSLRSFALNSLNEHINLLWPEVSNSIAQMYVLRLELLRANSPQRGPLRR
jgi:26S proteasome regulatory subunit N2